MSGSNLLAVLLSSAARIAQALNMHRIGPDPSNIQPEKRLDREIQKSMWLFLCVQDWFFIPFVNSHCIYPNHCTTPLPLNCDGIAGIQQGNDTFNALPMNTPTHMTYLLNMYKGEHFRQC
jgi:hypothetical protein